MLTALRRLLESLLHFSVLTLHPFLHLLLLYLMPILLSSQDSKTDVGYSVRRASHSQPNRDSKPDPILNDFTTSSLRLTLEAFSYCPLLLKLPDLPLFSQFVELARCFAVGAVDFEVVLHPATLLAQVVPLFLCLYICLKSWSAEH